MKMPNLSKAICFSCAFALMTCTAQATEKQAEVIHWWVSGGESAAIQTAIEAYENRGYKWINTPVEDSYNAKSAAISRMLDGNPPAMVQWQAGVALKELYQEGLLRDRNQLAKDNN